jgi:uncharacterized protein YceH (UPF0502 family)
MPGMVFDLDPVQARVLGSLSEKDLATPEYYPLSLNALLNACNQKTNREPVVQYDEVTVRAALAGLAERGWVREVFEPGSRVPKYSHCLVEKFELRRSEQAVLTVLLLRGPQTPGELRTRADRLYDFPDLDSVLTALRRLSEREPAPLVRQLPRQPGMKESRWAHLLCGDVETCPSLEEPLAPRQPSAQQLEARLAAVEEQLRLHEERLARLEHLCRTPHSPSEPHSGRSAEEDPIL